MNEHMGLCKGALGGESLQYNEDYNTLLILVTL